MFLFLLRLKNIFFTETGYMVIKKHAMSSRQPLSRNWINKIF